MRNKMTEQEKRGRAIAIVIAVGLAFLNLLGVFGQRAMHSPQFNWLLLVPVGWSLFLAWSLSRGQNWARWFLVLSLVINGLIILPSFASAHSLLSIMILSTIILFCFGTAVILWRSRSVEAYCTRLTPHEQELFSTKDQDGV